MNQPTREEFEAFKAEIRGEVKQLKEQVTEPMRVVLEQKPMGIESTLDNHTAFLQELDRKVDIHTQAFMRVEKRLEAIAEVQKLILERLPERG